MAYFQLELLRKIVWLDVCSSQKRNDKKRKFTDWKVTHDETICIVCWQDNGVVTLASSFAGLHEMDKATSWSES